MLCGTVLLSMVKQNGNRFEYKPRKVYCFYGIKTALSNLLKNPDFLMMCNSWKDGQSEDTEMCDIVDEVWQEQMERLKS